MKRDVKNVLGTGVILFLVLFIFGNHCPIENIVGIPCPGCNMFSAIYWLLQKDFTAAWFFHPVVFLLVPYLVAIGLLFVRKREQLTKDIAFRILTGILLCALIGVYVWRMLYVFPQYPMQLNEHAPVIRLLNAIF